MALREAAEFAENRSGVHSVDCELVRALCISGIYSSTIACAFVPPKPA
jgi:hypothetical protein